MATVYNYTLMSRDDVWVHSMTERAQPGCEALRRRHRADTIYLLVMGGRVIAMQSGFGMLEAAYVRPMNAANIMMKNLMDMQIGALAFYFFGYGIAYGGETVPSLEETSVDWAMWFCQFSYATTAATIDSGALAGRVSFVPYLLLSFVVTGLIYPLCVRWTWGGGWLGEMGYLDFAGGSIVHLVGGVSALVCALVCGPRIGRFKNYHGWRGPARRMFVERNPDSYYCGPLTEVERRVFSDILPISNPVQALFGVFLLLVGFLAFNPASTFATTNDSDLMAARTTITTLLTIAGSGLACFSMSIVKRRSLMIGVPQFATMIVASMVASCGCCDVIPPALAIPLGFSAAILADVTQSVLERFSVDDVVGAVAAHGPPGALGVICVPLVARPHCQSELKGLLFGGGHEAWRLLGVQCLGILVLTCFSAIATYVVVFTLDLLCGFRVNRATELIGLDYMEHGFEDGSFAYGGEKAEIKETTPCVDSVVERIKRVCSPQKAYTQTQRSQDGQDGPSSTPSQNNLPAPPASDAVPAEELRKEITALREEVSMMKHLIRRRSTTQPGVFLKDISSD